jgi:ribosome biogenesis GTPase
MPKVRTKTDRRGTRNPPEAAATINPESNYVPFQDRPSGINRSAMPGVVVRAYGKWFNVQLHDEERLLLSTLKGTLKRERRKTDLVAVGDRVWVVDVGDDEGQIEAVEPRVRVLARPARNADDVEQVILANPDQVLLVFAVSNPSPHRRMLDRFLVLAEYAALPAIIGVNKVDLDEVDETGLLTSKAIFGDYEAVYPVHYLSAKTDHGIAELRETLSGKITVVAGPSGVGKSSLLNRLDPENRRAIGEISTATGKGRHTTTATQLYRLDPTTFIADTPGIRALAMHGVPPDELDRCFPELRPWLGDCFYADCTHLHEPGCAVRQALEDGKIPPERYESYASLRRGDTADE